MVEDKLHGERERYGLDKLACYGSLIIQKTQRFLESYARAQHKESCKIVVMLLSSQMGCELWAP